MQIIKNKQISESAWSYLPDDAAVTEGDITVSLSRLKQNAQTLLDREGKLGVRINPDDIVAEIADFLPKLAMIELHFPDLADGRLFSHAWLLRNRHGYAGEIRATGNFLPDQVFYLARVGVDSFAADNPSRLNSVLTGLQDFSVSYQPSVN